MQLDVGVALSLHAAECNVCDLGFAGVKGNSTRSCVMMQNQVGESACVQARPAAMEDHVQFSNIWQIQRSDCIQE